GPVFVEGAAPGDVLEVREMIDFLVTEKRLSRDDAYMLTSVAADLSITQLVDGNKGVHASIAKAIFGPATGRLPRKAAGLERSPRGARDLRPAAPRPRRARVVRDTDRDPDRRRHLQGHRPGVDADRSERDPRLPRPRAGDPRDLRGLFRLPVDTARPRA